MKYSDDIDLKGRVAMVTGAARGIGRACALALAEAGADIAMGLRKLSEDHGLRKEIEAMGRKALPLQMDVSELDQIRNAVEKAGEYFGKIDILVNNAGIAPGNYIESVNEKDFDLTLAVNLKGTFFVSQLVGEWMIKNKYGRIINLSSQAGFIALPTESVYCMTKAGISHITKCFAVEWAKHNINVNAVAPTFIYTPGTEEYLSDEAAKNTVLSKIALGRIGEAKEVANAVLFLASKGASLITGTTMLIDGGWTAT
ncbi:MAG: SDR family NAD(P)-dependent oxidoreductase [Chitinophagales bacterium]